MLMNIHNFTRSLYPNLTIFVGNLKYLNLLKLSF